MRITLAIALAASGGLAAMPATAQTRIVVGADASTGDYGSSRKTTIVTAPVSITHEIGNLEIGVSTSYMRIETPGLVFSGIDGTPVIMSPDLGGPRRVHRGWADPTVSASYRFALPSDFQLRATGRVKIPVDGRRSVSTGKVDWSASGELSRTFGRVTPFASLTYRKFGDVTGWDIRDGAAASVGASVPLGTGQFAASWDYARSTSRFVRNVHEVVAVYDAPVAQRFRIGTFVTAGLSSGAPSLGTGLRLTGTF